MSSFEKLVEGYVLECRSRGISELTVRIRENFLYKWGIWLRTSARVSVTEVNAEIIYKFLKSDAVFKSKSTVAGNMSHLRCFGAYLNREGIWKQNYLRWMPSPKIRVDSHVPKVLKKSDVENMLLESFKYRDRLHQYLWPAMFLCIYSLGLRKGEVLRLNLSDWNAKEKTLRVSSTKSGWDRYLPLPDSAGRALEAYLPSRHRVLSENKKPDQTALFVSRSGDRVTAMSCGLQFKKIANRAGIKKFHLHQLRHTCATHLLESGVNLPEVKMVLGHSCIVTTVRYVQVSGPERRKAIDLHPINKMLETTP